ncbi:MAG: siderophore-interacting protein [Propioniciclava sp.]|uniref:siderophore-interacting protein n=1 Tax=Propioniciclava sp. TaxID=2038686 RepID=UPI0039E4B804
MAKRGFQGAVMRSFGARDHQATVVGTELLAPNFIRVRMTSPTLFDEAIAAPTAWLRFWFPDPDGGDIEYQRAYTLSEADPDTGAFACDFVLHTPAGPASAWATSVGPGATVPVMTLGSSKFELPDDLPAGYLLIGDSASIPGITGILTTIPAEVPIELYLEEHDPSDHLIPLPGHPRLRTHWVPRRDAESLAASLEARDWSDWKAWVACESASLKAVRTRLRDEFGFPKSEIYAQAYWIQGRSMGKNRGNQTQENTTSHTTSVATIRHENVPDAAASAPAARIGGNIPTGTPAEPARPLTSKPRRPATTSLLPAAPPAGEPGVRRRADG